MEAQHNPPERGKENRETGDSLAETKNIRQQALPNVTSEMENHPRDDSTTSHHAMQAEMAAQATPQNTSTPSAETPSASQELNLLTASDADFAAWITEFISRVAFNAGVLYDQSVMDRLAELGAADMGRWTFLIQQCKLEKKALKGVPIRDWQAKMEKQIATIQKATEAAKQEANQASDLQVLDRDAPLLLQQGWSAMESRLTALIKQYGAQPVLMYPTTIKLCAAAIAAGFKAECQTWQDRLVAAREGWTSRQAKTWMDQFKPSRTKAAQHQWDVLDGTESAPGSSSPAPLTVGEVWPDAPDALKSWPLPNHPRWNVTWRGIHRIVDVDAATGDAVTIPVTYTPLFITGGAEPLDVGGEGWAELTWRSGKLWKQAWFPRKDMMTRKNIPETLNTHNIRVVDDEMKFVVKWLEETEDAGLAAGVWSDQYLANTLGWKEIQKGQWGFMLPKQWIGPTLPGGQTQVVFWPQSRGGGEGATLYQPQGRIEDESQLMADVLHMFPHFAWLLGQAAAAPLLRRLKAHNLTGNMHGYVIELANAQSSNGKTSLTALALAPWRATEIPIANYSSEFALEQYLVEMNDLPTAIQELQANQRSKISWSEAIHMIAEKGGRMRGQKKGGYTVPEAIHTVLFMANNQSVLSMIDDQAGAAARVFSMNHIIPRDMLEDPRQTVTLKHCIENWMAQAAQSHGNGGPQLIAALTVMTDDELIAQYKSAQAVTEPILAQFKAPSGEIAKVIGRQSHAWALGLTGLRLLLQYGYNWTPEQIAAIEPGYVDAIQGNLLPRSTFNQAPEAEVWWDIVRDLIVENSSEIAGLNVRLSPSGDVIPPKQYIGRYFPDEDIVAIVPRWLKEELEKGKRKDTKSLFEEWSRKGWLVRGKDQFPQTRRLINVANGLSFAAKVLCFRASALGIGAVEPTESLPLNSQEPVSDDANGSGTETDFGPAWDRLSAHSGSKREF
jgi:hypothetical protein